MTGLQCVYNNLNCVKLESDGTAIVFISSCLPWFSGYFNIFGIL